MSWLAPARPKAVLRLIACALAPLAIASIVTAAEQRPNIIVILADDIGYSDIGCYGGEIATPNLDKLAAGGVRFTHFYNTGRCCPTRASLLTGLYPHQAGMGWMTGYQGTGGYAGDLNRQCVTLAEVLRPAGYNTYMVGKWHVTPAPNRQQVEEDKIDRNNWPLSRGFDRYYGTIQGAGSYFDPGMLVRDEELIAPENPDSYYYTDALSDNASRMIREHNRQKPFLMYLAYTAAHWPLHAKPADMAKYKGKYSEGWDKMREARLARMKAEGLVPEKAELAPHVKEWQHEELQDWQAARMEAYAAMIDSMDQGIGRVVETLRNTGQLDNTLILYLQDNGACAEEGRSNQAREMRDKLEPTEPMGKDEVQLASVPEFTRDGRPVLWGRGVMPGPANTYMEVGREWANASNTPFRLFKHYVHEGGIATPLIAHWPRGISRRGDLEHQPGHLIDIMPTLVELAGATYPEKFHEGDQAITPVEGVSLIPAFESKPLERKEPLFWEHEGNRAVRHGDWKLVARGATGNWQLYNLKDDPSELTDLAEDEPERVAELSGMWGAWASRSGVLPLTPYWPKPEAETQNAGEKAKPAVQPAAVPKVTTADP